MVKLRESVSTLLAIMATLASGSAVSFCPPNANSVCFAVGVPSSSASSGSGNIYFQIRAPASNSWVALGTGSQMQGSNMFLIYQDGRGNITLSPRQGTRWTMPTLDTSSTAAKLTLLSGSGLSADGNTMTANIACANCQTWSGGSMGLADTSTGWIGAWKSGSSLATTNAGANIQQHDDTVTFSLDLSKASIASDSNPFTNAESGSGSGGATVISANRINPKVLYAHGIIMAILFVILFPIASMAMPLVGKWKVHGGVQTFNFVLMWIGFGLGVQTAKERNLLFNNPHTTLGTVVVCLLIIQPFLGYAHHMHYVKYQRRGPVSYAHIFWGQSLMVIGLVNGGLGLEMAGASNHIVVAYAVISALIFVLYVIVKVFTMNKASRKARARGNENMYAMGRGGHKEGNIPSSSHRRPYP